MRVVMQPIVGAVQPRWHEADAYTLACGGIAMAVLHIGI
jgi:hypothetical protein